MNQPGVSETTVDRIARAFVETGNEYANQYGFRGDSSYASMSFKHYEYLKQIVRVMLQKGIFRGD